MYCARSSHLSPFVRSNFLFVCCFSFVRALSFPVQTHIPYIISFLWYKPYSRTSVYVSHVSLPLFVASLRSCGCSLVVLSLRCTSDHSCCCSRLCLRHGLESRLRQTSDCITSSSVPFTCHRLFTILKKDGLG